MDVYSVVIYFQVDKFPFMDYQSASNYSFTDILTLLVSILNFSYKEMISHADVSLLVNKFTASKREGLNMFGVGACHILLSLHMA